MYACMSYTTLVIIMKVTDKSEGEVQGEVQVTSHKKIHDSQTSEAGEGEQKDYTGSDKNATSTDSGPKQIALVYHVYNYESAVYNGSAVCNGSTVRNERTFFRESTV